MHFKSLVEMTALNARCKDVYGNIMKAKASRLIWKFLKQALRFDILGAAQIAWNSNVEACHVANFIYFITY